MQAGGKQIKLEVVVVVVVVLLEITTKRRIMSMKISKTSAARVEIFLPMAKVL